jgi:hypothetical protein
LINFEIINTAIGWSTVMDDIYNNPKEIMYPQDITICFSNHQKIFIGAAQFLNDNDVIASGISDNLLVTNNEVLARQIKLII